MDYYIKVWKIPQISQSDQPNYVIQTALHSSNRILKEYIDCVQWFGPLIICKGIHGRLRIFRFIPDSNSIDVICDLFYPVPSPLWYFRFSIDPISKLLAVGSPEGKIFLFNLTKTGDAFSLEPERMIRLRPTNERDSSLNVRDLIFLNDRIVSITEEGKIFVLLNK